MAHAIESFVSERLLSVMGDPLLLGIFVLGIFVLWLIVTKMDRVGIIFISLLLVGTLSKIGYLPIIIWYLMIIATGFVVIASFFRSIGEQ